MEVAYRLACEEDTQEVFNACVNLVGHREAGKTSLATRMMGKEFKQDVKSTEGVSMHLIKSTVKPNLIEGSMWNETTQDSSDLLKHFSHAVLLKARQISVKQKINKSTSSSRNLVPQQKKTSPLEMEINRKPSSTGSNIKHREAESLVQRSPHPLKSTSETKELQRHVMNYHPHYMESNRKPISAGNDTLHRTAKALLAQSKQPQKNQRNETQSAKNHPREANRRKEGSIKFPINQRVKQEKSAKLQTKLEIQSSGRSLSEELQKT